MKPRERGVDVPALITENQNKVGVMTVEEMISVVGRMDAEDRLRLMDALWETLPPEDRLHFLESYRQTSADWAQEQGLLPWQRELLDERLAAAESDPGGGVPWQEAMARLTKKYEKPS